MSASAAPFTRSVCVYCASSRSSHPQYREAAARLGAVLAGAGITIVYGGGAVGSMGALADGALSRRRPRGRHPAALHGRPGVGAPRA